MHRRLSGALFACAILALNLSSASGAKAQFYANKTVTLVVNYGAGGNADVSARVFQQFLAKHLAGRPSVIVQNMPGAGGYVAMNMLGLGLTFKPDGLNAGFFGLSPPGLIAQDPGLKVSMHDFAIVGAVKDWDIAYARKDASPGLEKPADIAKAHEIYAGGYGRSNVNDARSGLALKALGVPFKMITGFQGTADLNKAMAQNEINFINSALPAYLNQALPQIIKPGLGIPLFYYAGVGADGKPATVPLLEKMGIASFAELYRQIKGVEPSGPDFDALFLMSDLDSAMHGVIALPKGTPPEAIKAMRQAFAELQNDDEFKQEYKRVTGEDPVLAQSDEVDSVVKRLDSVSPDVRALFKNMIGL